MQQRLWLQSFAALAFVASAYAQTAFPEVEPNDTRAASNVITCLNAGDSITGLSTGISTVTPGAASADFFRVNVCATTPGLYVNRLTLTTTGTVGHGGCLRGFSQTAGVIVTTGELDFQLSTTATAPQRMNQWFGFGQAEQVTYRVTGTTSTTAGYTSTYTSTPYAPINVAGFFNPGTITVSTVGQTTVDTEIYVYDANFNMIPNGHNDDEGPGGLSAQSRVARTLAAGDYYAVISRFELSNGTADANVDEDFLTAIVLDGTGMLVTNNATAAIDCDFTISDGVTTVPVTAVQGLNFEPIWAKFTVGTPVVFQPFCAGDGSLTDHTTPCPCGNNGAPGNGCGHSFDPNGANMSATGTAAADDVVLHSQFEPASSFTLMMQHGNSGDAVFHDGVLCAGNPLIRLRGRSAVGGEAFFPNSNFAQDSTTTLSARGGTFPGSGATMRYAAWYRNASTTFCPPATANVTNGWLMVW